ncbi:MAG TPA: 5-formyltetrahydrofolate cyclo-ligase [Nannocystaceae bacterium]|nr:5-formyltetrahydrofolate cyclo-ligase [Nannocystaceae bacterium]
MDDRTALRAALLQRRRALGDDEVERASRALALHVRASAAWQRARVVAAFYGVRREPHTAPLLDLAIADGKALWLPVVRDHGLVFARVQSTDELVAAGFGLREPVAPAGAPSLGALAPALVLVPGLAFGKSGARIGFGRGHYDRALAPLRNDAECVRMGVCFASFLDPPEGVIPMDDHDVPMHHVATELGIIDCNPQ